MQVGPVDWPKFKAAIEALKSVPAPGRSSSEVYRSQADSSVLVLERWESHAAMHSYQDKVGDDFNQRAGTAGLDWQTGVWEFAESM
jgi:hypothetical protein